MRITLPHLSALTALALTLPASAALSNNLFVNGNFESTANLRSTTTPDGVLPHRFSQTYDLGNWIAHWGPPTAPGGLGGFSYYDDPHDIAQTGGNNMTSGNLGNFNRSVDPLNPSNHIIEAALFRPTMAQWIAAPATQVPGPFRFSFDLLMQNNFNSDSWGTISLYGMDYLPPNDVTFFRDAAPGAPGATYSVLDPDRNPGDGQLLFTFTYGKWIDGSTDGNDPPFQFFDTWHHYDTAEYLENINGAPIEPDGSPDYQWWGSRQVNTNLTQTFPYYVVTISPVVYDEVDPFFWLYGGRIPDGLVFGFDNINLQLSLNNPPVRPFQPGDFNLDGLVNVQDINPFVLALGYPSDFVSYLINRMAELGISISQLPLIAFEIDPFHSTDPPELPDLIPLPGSGGVATQYPYNVQDINNFIAALAGNGVDTANLTLVIPEPASLALLSLGAMILIRRRR